MPRISPAQRPLIDAMDHYYLAAFELYSRAPAEYEPQVRQCANRAVLIVQKMLRVAALLPDTLLGPLRSKDERLYGNLLLVDALEQEQSPAVLALARQIGAHTSDFEEAREHFRPALDALLSALPRGTRAQVKKLVLGRGAPSPFVVVERPEPPVCGCGARHPRAHPL